VRACEESGCLLLGGETAEMPGFYDNNKFDLAGFAVGEVYNKDLVDGKSITAGDAIIGLPSSGFHANGYSLVRKILKDNQLSLESEFEGKKLGDLLTAPTKLYVKDVLAIQKQFKIKGMAHITGGGLTNIARVLPEGRNYHIEKSNIPTPNFMKYLQNLGHISQEEAFTVWNMGLGFVMIVDKKDVDGILAKMPGSFIAGDIV
jgi:phosphoribosylformylglycinamidine cyclo-ligase